ncbi:MAG: glycyl-tRNA synthetase beta chain, partial [Paracoccaceae bacterium]
PKNDRIEQFITVANRETADQGATILAGNQKVLSARLADAKFFWDNDLRIAHDDMSIWTQDLENVTFHNKLGTQADRIRRIASLSRELSGATGADADQAETAALLAKADLSSELVYEFPELQGLMGRYYIAASGQDAAIAAVAEEHYSPLGPSDDVPSAPLSVTVALADKLDTLTGFWAIDEKPTGSKDPFALRRAALGVIRLILDNDLRVPLDRFIDSQLLKHKIHMSAEAREDERGTMQLILQEIAEHGVFGAAYKTVIERLDGDDKPDTNEGSLLQRLETAVPDLSVDLLAFFHDRLKVFLRDQGVRQDIIDACIAMPGNDDLNLLVKRARALSDVLDTEDGENLIQGFKRANNILSQAEEKDGVEYSYGADLKFAEDDSERALFVALDVAKAAIKPALEAEDFPTAMAAMAALRAPIDAFFEAVQVNTDKQTVRRNRLNMLSRIRQTCSSVADLTRIDG